MTRGKTPEPGSRENSARQRFLSYTGGSGSDTVYVMSCHRSYDTVAFDVRDNAMMLFFARTTAEGEIDDYLLLMRGDGDKISQSVYIEMNERQLAGQDLIREARMSDNMLTLILHQPAPELDGEAEIVLSYAPSADNKASVEAGAFRVLGDCLAGGHA